VSEKDPVLVAQEKTRAGIDKVLAKYGWKLGRVGVRGLYVDYHLERLDGGKQVVHSILLSDIVAWSLHPPTEREATALEATGLTVECFLLGVSLLLRVRMQNAVDNYTPPPVPA